MSKPAKSGKSRKRRVAEDVPLHRPRKVLAHLADEYADLATHASTLEAGHEGGVVAKELRRPLSRRVQVRDGLTVMPKEAATR